MQGTQFIVLSICFALMILTSAVLMYGHRPLARRLVKDPTQQPRRSVELAAGWPPTLLAFGFPLMALLMPIKDLEGGFGYGVVGFFGLGTVWMFAVAKVPALTKLMAHQAHAATFGSQDHGETPELYREVLKEGLPRAAVIVALAFVIALLRVLIQA